MPQQTFVKDTPLTANPVDLHVNCSSGIHVPDLNAGVLFSRLPAVVGLSGHAGAGKSTCASWLQERGYQRIRFAGLLKNMLRALGLGEKHVDGGLKETPHRLLNGRTPRQAMQWLGTEWGRAKFGDGFWVDLWLSQVEAALRSGRPVVADDLRFDNEAAAVHGLGGIVVRIECPWAGSTSGAGHASEAGLNLHDIAIANDVRDRPDRMLARLGDALGFSEGTDGAHA